MKTGSTLDPPGLAERPPRGPAAHDIVNHLFRVGLELHQVLRVTGDQCAAGRRLREALDELDAAINGIRRMLYAEPPEEDAEADDPWPDVPGHATTGPRVGLAAPPSEK